MQKKITILSVVLSASVAQAECPNPDALTKGGIYVRFEGGNFTHYRRNHDGLIIEEEYTRRFGATYQIISHYGIYKTKEAVLRSAGEASETEYISVIYAVPADELVVPAPGLEWRGSNTLIYPPSPFYDGIDTTREEMKLSVDEQVVLTLGGCALIALPYKVRYEWPENETMRDHQGYYLPDYGMTIARTDPVGPVTATAISNKRPSH